MVARLPQRPNRAGPNKSGERPGVMDTTLGTVSGRKNFLICLDSPQRDWNLVQGRASRTLLLVRWSQSQTYLSNFGA